MHRRLTFTLLMFALPVAASVVLLFDTGTGRNLRLLTSADTLQYSGKPGALINPVLPTNNLDRCYVTNGQVKLLPAAILLSDWLVASNAGWSAALDREQSMKQAASTYLNGLNADARIMRAFALLTLDQINTLRTRASLSIITTNTFLSAMSNAVLAAP
jgi:hypothetical protein